MRNKTSTVSGPMELNARIAKLLGWADVQRSSLNPDFFVGRKPGALDIEGRTFLPHFCDDLNECAAFEAAVPLQYWKNLAEIVGYGMMSISWQNLRLIGRATAQQRCEAFVKTMEAPSVEPKATKSDNASGSPKSPSITSTPSSSTREGNHNELD